MKIIDNNSEILLITDCVNNNPNGNPDAENAPRMDENTEILLVSDVRIKRNIRDSAINDGLNVFVRKVYDKKTGEEKTTTASDRAKDVQNIKDCIDVRFFGCVSTVDNMVDYTGPIQFAWGTSMHKVVVSDHGIITTFKTKDTKNDLTGSMGRDKRVDYALISMQGRINANTAKKTGLTDEDMELFDKYMVNLYDSSNTRSKIGQTVRLYLRVETTNGKVLKSLQEYVRYVSEKEYPNALSDGYVEVNELIFYLNKNKKYIDTVKIYVDDKIDIRVKDEKVDLITEIKDLGVKVVDLEV